MFGEVDLSDEYVSAFHHLQASDLSVLQAGVNGAQYGFGFEIGKIKVHVHYADTHAAPLSNTGITTAPPPTKAPPNVGAVASVT